MDSMHRVSYNDISDNNPEYLNKFLIYIETILGRSSKTAHEYYLDIRLFLRFLKIKKILINDDYSQLNNVLIHDIDINFIRNISLIDIYEFLNYTVKKRLTHQNSDTSPIGISARSRSRKISSLRTFFKYLTDKVNLIENNPTQNLDTPKFEKRLPKYLTVQQSTELLQSVDGPFKKRDYCILTLFLNCGLRVSELVGLNLNDISDNKIRVLGKGNKERMIYLNHACTHAINQYLPVRTAPNDIDRTALFISRQRNRINVQTIKWLVKKYIVNSGLDPNQYSTHKLRHTAATLMYQNGADIRTLQTILGHEQLNTTMIYTHIENIDMQKAINFNPMANIEINLNQHKREKTDNTPKNER